mmetsp:Transcript_9769/g.16225  ORF Transcript_9769/g.16225 Transcript_9769/m.16225 type:complete len:181 (+) Transcript_9769:182-724(+)
MAGSGAVVSAFTVVGSVYTLIMDEKVPDMKYFAASAIIPTSFACLRTPRLYSKAISRGLAKLNKLSWATVTPLVVETMGIWTGSTVLIAYLDHAAKWPRSGFQRMPLATASGKHSLSQKPEKTKFWPKFSTVWDGVACHAYCLFSSLAAVSGIALIVSLPVTLPCGYVCMRYGIKKVLKL